MKTAKKKTCIRAEPRGPETHMAKKIDDAQRARLSETLPQWTLVQGRDAIQRSFKFKYLQ